LIKARDDKIKCLQEEKSLVDETIKELKAKLTEKESKIASFNIQKTSSLIENRQLKAELMSEKSHNDAFKAKVGSNEESSSSTIRILKDVY